MSDHRLKVRCSYVAKRLPDMDMVNAIKDEYVDEYEVVRSRLEEIIRARKLMRFVITPEMAVGIVISVTTTVPASVYRIPRFWIGCL